MDNADSFSNTAFRDFGEPDRAAAAIFRVALEMGSDRSFPSKGVRAPRIFGNCWTRIRKGSSRMLRNVTACREVARASSGLLHGRPRIASASTVSIPDGVRSGFNGGELPHARKERAVTTTLPQQESASVRIEQNACCERYVHGRTFFARPRQFILYSQFSGATPTGCWTLTTLGRFRRAHGCAQFHHGLVPITGRLGGQQLLGRSFQFSPSCRGAQITVQRSQSSQHARDVSVQDGQRFPVSNAEDCGSRVAPDSGQCQRRIVVGGELAIVLGGNLLGGPVQISGAAVISESRPVAEHRFGCRAREVIPKLKIAG